MNQTRLGQVSILLNVLLFMAIAVSGYFNITIEKFLTTFLVMPSAVFVLGYVAKRGGIRVDIGWRIEVAVSFFCTFGTLFYFLADDWFAYDYNSPLFSGLIIMCLLTNDLFAEIYKKRVESSPL